MCFTGNPGTGKTTVAMRMAEILHRLGYLRRGHLVAVTRDDLVGQYVGHTAPKTKEALKRAMGGVLFIDEAYYLYRPENERDYGQEAIEILLQVMESARDDLVVILAGYRRRMDVLLRVEPGDGLAGGPPRGLPRLRGGRAARHRRAHAGEDAVPALAGRAPAFQEYLALRMAQPRFSNARSVRNALDRARLRQASRLFARGGRVDQAALSTLEAEDLRQSRVFTGGLDPQERAS